jgi:hypothetical protein
MSNEKPLKLNMTFREALQMIAKGGKPPPAIPPPVIKKKTAKKAAPKKPSATRGQTA